MTDVLPETRPAVRPLRLPAKSAVFRVVVEAKVGEMARRLEAIYDTRPETGPQLLSWRRLRGNESS